MIFLSRPTTMNPAFEAKPRVSPNSFPDTMNAGSIRKSVPLSLMADLISLKNFLTVRKLMDDVDRENEIDGPGDADAILAALMQDDPAAGLVVLHGFTHQIEHRLL